MASEAVNVRQRRIRKRRRQLAGCGRRGGGRGGSGRNGCGGSWCGGRETGSGGRETRGCRRKTGSGGSGGRKTETSVRRRRGRNGNAHGYRRRRERWRDGVVMARGIGFVMICGMGVLARSGIRMVVKPVRRRKRQGRRRYRSIVIVCDMMGMVMVM